MTEAVTPAKTGGETDEGMKSVTGEETGVVTPGRTPVVTPVVTKGVSDGVTREVAEEVIGGLYSLAGTWTA